MSNVLIGIIGVILFIGLALAGALFLGPRFQDARISSRAAQEMQQVQQMAHAITLFETSEGEKYDSSKQARLIPAYLKSLPQNADHSNNAGYIETGTNYAYMALGTDSVLERKVCQSIQRTLTGSETIEVVTGTTVTRKSGCYTDAGGSSFIVYARP